MVYCSVCNEDDRVDNTNRESCLLIINTTTPNSYRHRTTTNDVEQHDGVESVKGLDETYTTRFTTDLDSSERSKDD